MIVFFANTLLGRGLSRVLRPLRTCSGGISCRLERPQDRKRDKIARLQIRRGHQLFWIVPFQYWGKADEKYTGEPKWHPLAYHCLDAVSISSNQ